jgi:four helix bundle protein
MSNVQRMQDYHDLDVWHEAHAHILKVRKATNRFPRTGYATLKKQLLEAVESIAFNIVEGCGASTQKEFARFLDISIKSSHETQYQLELAGDYEILPDAHGIKLRQKTVQIRKMLCGLRKRVLESLEEDDEPDEPEDPEDRDNPKDPES